MRGKIMVPNLIAVLVVGLIGYFFLSQELSTHSVKQLDERLRSTQRLFSDADQFNGIKTVQKVTKFAQSNEMKNSFAALSPIEGETAEAFDERVRQTWASRSFKSAEYIADMWRQESGKHPEFVFLTDRNGVVVTRNTSPRACPAGFNVSKALPVVQRALDGSANYTIWSIDDSPFSSKKTDSKFCQLMNTGMLEVAAAPIEVIIENNGDLEEKIVGVLVLGYEISNGAAQKKSKAMNMDFAVLKDGKVYSSSFDNDTFRENLGTVITGTASIKSQIDAVVEKNVASGVFELNVNGKTYRTIAGRLANSDPKDKVSYIIMGSVTKATSHLSTLSFLLLFMGIAIVIVVIAGIMLGGHFLKPVEAIEEGLLKVINGEFEYRFEVESAEVGGLSYRINQLISVLTGEEEEDAE